jgi:hypothetical protein
MGISSFENVEPIPYGVFRFLEHGKFAIQNCRINLMGIGHSEVCNTNFLK